MSIIVRVNIIFLFVFCFIFMSYAEVTPVADRTPAVRDAIVKAIDGVDAAADVTAEQLVSITALNLRNKDISELKAGDFSGLTGLVDLNLYGNKLSELPAGIFEGLTSLTTIRLGGNSVNPMPFTVSLEKVASGQFKAVVPAGALFDIVLPITVANGSLTEGVATVTIPKGSVESGILNVTRTAGTTAAVNVEIGTLPSLPSRNHYGYALVKSESLPLSVISGINTAPVFSDGTTVTRSVAENTDADVDIGTPVSATDTENDVLTWTLGGSDADAFDIDSATGQLKTKAALDYETKPQYTVTITASDGTLTDTITVTINVTDIDEVVDPPIQPDPSTPNTAPVFSEGARTVRVVPENTDAGVHIGIPVSATDTENDVLTWTLGGADAFAFDIDSTTGQLKTEAALDYETKRVYSVTITVADEALSDTIVVIISVIDVNDTPISAGFVPVADRTPQVRDAIVAAVPNVAAAADVTEAQVAAITSLNLRNKSITSLKTGDFSGMVLLSALNLHSNQLRSVPMGLFTGLSSLRSLRLGSNAIHPLPMIVSLQQVGVGAFRAVVPSGAPFDVVLPIRVTDGSIRGGLRSVTISQGSVGSPAFTVDGTSAKVSFGTLPELPSNHFGYTLAQTAIFNRTPEVTEAILKALDLNDPSAVTDTDIAMITRLDLDDMDITSLRVDDFAGMLSLQTLTLGNNKLTTLPVGIFSDLTALVNLSLEGNSIETLPSNVFEGLSLLLMLNLADNELTGLSGTFFDGIPNIRSLSLSNNKLTALPAGIFEGVTQLTQLQLNGNAVDPLPILVSLQKVGEDQFMARVLVGAPLTLALPITVKNGEIVGGVGAVTIPIGEVESQPLTVARTPDTIDAVTVDFGTLPTLPASHNGYAVVTSGTLPLEVLEPLNVPPVFTEGADTVRSIRENTAVDVDIGEAVSATDQDTADTLTYTLGGTDADSFSIDAKTGQLKTKAALDYETKASYSVVVTVSDGKASDSITVSIVVIDVDENRAPVFSEGESTTRSVDENTDAGENIGEAVTATDADDDTLTYSLAGTDAAAFALNTQTGQLKTSAALDYETKNVYTVVLNASDGKLTTPITVVISITDVVDEAPAGGTEAEEQRQTANNPPVFAEGESTTRTVLEGTASGEDIGQAVTATDADGHTLTWTLGGTDAAAFSIDSSNGQLRTEAALDYEAKSTYTVTITVSDSTDSATIDVTINVADTTENNVPAFTAGTSTTRLVAENTGSGVDIGAAIAATDVNEDTLTYSLGGSDAAAFSIDSTTGQLRTEAALDYETKSTYTVTITVSDGRGGTDSIIVTINVTEAQENRAPVFSEDSTTRNVAENTGSGIDIGEPVSATDADDDTLTYSLGGTDAAAFSLDSTTGQLRTEASLDYETKSTYTVTITVSDGRGGTDSITVTINVTDVEEAPENNAPAFDEDETTRTSAENTDADTNIGAAITATDADDDTLTYSLGGTDADAFSIDTETGQLKTKAALDYETKKSYTVTVIASDGTLTDSISVTINVTDVNEAPEFADGDSTTRAIAENVPEDINIGSAVAATDPEKSKLTYTLGGTNAAAFSIDVETGQLKTKAALDFEDKDSYSVTITVSDGSLTDTITVTINVTNLEERPSNTPPVFDDGTSTTRSVAENTEADENIGSPIAATDADENTLAYLLSGTDAAAFAIDSTTGQLKTNAALNHETKDEYTVNVVVSDGSGTDTISVTIQVTDVNEAPVIAADTDITRSVAENTEAGENIGSAITATDEDDGDTLTWTLGGTDAESFDIVRTSGQLQTKAALDYEDKDAYSVTVNVSDGNLTDSIDITINITDIDENRAPAFSGDTATRSIAENTGAGQDIGNPMTATDPDGDDLEYSLGGADEASFSIVSTSGQLRTKAALDYESKNRYEVTVSVSDGSLEDTITVTINVTDVQENRAPAFSSNTATRSVAEDTDTGQDIGAAITATDPDNDSLTYSLEGTDAAAFSIASTTGQLRTKAALDYESKTQYKVTVKVSDGSLEDTITVTINVTDVQENRAPTFSDGTSATRSIAENTGTGQNIGSAVGATDADNDKLTYTLGGTDEASFSIVGSSGQLRTKSALNYETKSEYSVTVSVSDGNGGSDSITVTINVTDVNEAPVFSDGASTTRSIAENTGAGQNIGSAVGAEDPENNSLSYSLGGTDKDSFAIVTSSGQLQTKAALDYESKTQYKVTVSVSDGNGGSDSITVTINVTDVNEAPVFSDGASTTRSIAENTGAGQNIGSAVGAEDPENNSLSYSLGGTDKDSFAIVTSSGQLQTKAALDYETKSSYEVTVSVSDGNGGSDSIAVTINVSDVNENSAPVFTDGTSTTRSVAENTAAAQNIGTPVAATDADTDDTLTYTLGGTDAASFAIVSTSGQLQTKAALDFETKSSYEVTVSVSDGNSGSDSITVTINVTDVTETQTTQTEETQTEETQTEETQTTTTTITPVKERSSNVRAAIVAAISGVNSAENVTAEHLAAIRNLTVTISLDSEGDVIGDNFFLSGDFSGLTDLRTLDISDAEDIDNLPSGIFDGLTSLRTLRMPDYYSGYTSGMFDDLTSLRTLNMTESAQSAIPSGIFDKLTNLRTLNMSNGVIETLPSGIFDKLTSLRTLNLRENFLETLPSGIFDKLTSLRTLDLRENFLDITTMQAEGFFNNIVATAEIKTADNIADAPAAAVSDVSRSTTLLPNYPNPFNPETWIPYQLEAPAKVTVTIYNVRGVVVRKLDLGHKLEGRYINRSRAAYWDGRNSVGEKVAAGLYFYTIKAGDFTATRKMLIRK